MANKDCNLTKEYLNQILLYKDGKLFWKEKISRKVIAGEKAGSVYKDGREHISINKKKYLSHRIIFMLHHGYMPDLVDHINNNSSDNRIENLRVANKITNAQNSGMRKDNTSGVKGVKWHKKHKLWVASFRVNKKDFLVGYFKDLSLAKCAIESARKEHHGSFARNS